jgi:hypothetical protein
MTDHIGDANKMVQPNAGPGHTPEDQWELIDEEHFCTLRIGDAYAGIPYQPPHGRGRCERQRADGRRIVACVKAMKDIPDPAAFVAAVREAVEMWDIDDPCACAIRAAMDWRNRP